MLSSMQIIADIHEKNSLVIAELVEKGIDVNFKQLEVADFVISEETAIERKTVTDFVSSMLDKRLLKQLSDLKRNYPKPLLILEGHEEQDIYKNARFPNLHENSVRGMMLSTVLEFQVPIIFTKDYKDTAHFLELLVKRQERPDREISLKAKRKAYNIYEQQQFILESFPGIGPTLAKELLKHFKTVKAFMNADKEELKKVKKMNDNKIDAILRIIENNYKN